MRKLWLLSLVAGVLASSVGNAQVVTYVFRSQETRNATKAVTTNSNLNEYAQLGVVAFAQNLAKDVSKNNCALQPFVKPTFTKAVVPVLNGFAKAGFLGGETTFGDGTITLDLTNGTIGGGILTSADASPQTSGTSTLVGNDYEDLGNQSLLCGGASSTTGPGTCGSVCTAEPIGTKGPKCTVEGGAPKVTDPQGIATGYAEMFLYPLANAPQGLILCTGPSQFTWAECCHDPNLVIVRHLHVAFSSDHSKVYGSITDEEAVGTFEGQQ